MLLKNKKILEKELSRKVSRILYALSICFFVVAAYNFYYSTRILPGVFIDEYNFGGMNKVEAVEKIRELYAVPPNFLTIHYTTDGKTYEDSYQINLDDIDFEYDLHGTYENAFATGRENPITPLKYVIGIFRPLKSVDIKYTYDENKLNSFLATFAAQKYPSVSNASFDLVDNQLVINEAQEGLELDLKRTKAGIEKGFSQYDFVHNVETNYYKPNVFVSDLQKIQSGVQNYIDSPLVFEYRKIGISASKEEKLKLIEFSKNSNGEVEVVPNMYGISAYLNLISAQVDIEAKGTQFEIKEDGNIIFSPPVIGLELDKDNLQKDLNDYVSNFDFTLDKPLETTIALSVSETTPEQNANEYGIKELIAEGVSYFSHSSANRISNIATASEKIKGTLVAPGEEFSFNTAVGPIDIEHGFNTAYVISKGRTVLGTGGGVCQVSTTVFRAALNSGLPIVKRTAHAYRVSYYEENSAVGLDATIYQPSVDFVFKNDMDTHILVYTSLNVAAKKLEVKIYGTKDGREVTVTEPIMLSQTPPPAPQYIDDPSLPAGKIVQEEWPSWGASTVFNRTVTKNGETLYEDEFKSYYTPWRAVYRRGV